MITVYFNVYCIVGVPLFKKTKTNENIILKNFTLLLILNFEFC